MLKPGDEKELAEAVAGAAGPLVIRGGGTRPVGHAVKGEVLSVAGLSGITLYEPGALTLVARAGTPVAEIEAALDAENQMLAFEPMDHRPLLGTEGVPTIGGVVAANVSGPRRVLAGACRDFLLGVRFVDGRGDVIKNGGRVMKNVTGYDLARLMCGARGTLGVLSEVSLKVLPKPEAQATLSLSGLDPAVMVAMMSEALASPYSVSGAASEKGVVHLRVEGLAQSVAYRADRLRRVFDRLGDGAEVNEGEASAALWSRLRNVEQFAGQDGCLWRLSAKPSDAMSILNAMPADADVLMDWGGGLLWIAHVGETDLRVLAGAFDGHATLLRAPADVKGRVGVFHKEAPPLERLAQGLRKQFDPRGILNPGLMG